MLAPFLFILILPIPIISLEPASYHRICRRASSSSRGAVSPIDHGSPSSKDRMKDEACTPIGERKIVGDDGVVDHRLFLMKSVMREKIISSNQECSLKDVTLHSHAPTSPRPPKRVKGTSASPLPADLLRDAFSFFFGNLNTENIRQVTPDSVIQAMDYYGVVSCLASYSAFHSKKLVESVFESDKKLSVTNLKPSESSKKLNEKLRESTSEIFNLSQDLESSHDLAKSFESLYNKANDQLKVELDKYQTLESHSASLIRSGFVMAQEEIARLYPELDLSGMSVPPSIPVSSTPLAVRSPVPVNIANPDMVEDDPSEDGKA